MFKKLFLSSIVAFALIIGSTHAYCDVAQDSIVKMVNDARVAVGLTRLVPNTALTATATTYASYLLETGQLTHFPLDRSSPTSRALKAGYNGYGEISELLTAGVTSPQRAVEVWNMSPAHRMGILTTYFREIGVGYAYNPKYLRDARHNYGYVWVVTLGCGPSPDTLVSPQIDSVTPLSVVTGTRVWVRGKSFGTYYKPIVKLNGVVQFLTYSSDTVLSFTVDVGDNSGYVSVKNSKSGRETTYQQALAIRGVPVNEALVTPLTTEQPVVDCLNPPYGTPTIKGLTVAVYGKLFGENCKVTYNGTEVVVKSVINFKDESVAYVTLPYLSVDGKFTVTNVSSNKSATSGQFLTSRSGAWITGVSPVVAKIGNLLLIQGYGFGNLVQGLVRFNNVVTTPGSSTSEYPVEMWNDYQIALILPGINAGWVEVSIITAGGQETNSITITIPESDVELALR